jgi:cytoskeleton protein RodZ
MSEFGNELRGERESRGIGLDAISEATKISHRHLLALEASNFDQLPGGVLNKGIVRGYARVVGLDQEAWVERFMAAYQGSGQLKDDDASWIEFAENVGKNRSHEAERPDVRLRWAGVALLLTLLAALGWFVWRYVSEKMSAEGAPQQSHAITTVAAISASVTCQIQQSPHA